MSRVLARRGLPRGRVSRSFATSDLVEASRESDNECAVYVELDSEGYIVAGGRNSAEIACRARLARDVHSRTAELSGSPAGWRLRAVADHVPHQELTLWFDQNVLALLDMPFLTLKNIRGRKNYVCHECGVQFEQPNPLKLHLFLSCREYTPPRFWRQFLAKLNEQRTPMNLSNDIKNESRNSKSPENQDTQRISAFQPYTCRVPSLPLYPPQTPMYPLTLPLPAAATPAEIEALATDWGRSQNGHLCLYCGKVYSRKYGLKIHIRTHTGYKPLHCKYCLRAFGDPSNLNKHVRLHAQSQGESPHACALCGKTLVRRRDLERHLRSRHADENIKLED